MPPGGDRKKNEDLTAGDAQTPLPGEYKLVKYIWKVIEIYNESSQWSVMPV